MKKLKEKKIDRYNIMLFITIIILVVIFIRLLYLQVYKYDESKEKANIRARRFVAEKAPRGLIYDSSGNILARNKETYNLTFTETDQATIDFCNTIDSVEKLLKEDSAALKDDFKIKIDDKKEFYFDFNTDNKNIKAQEIRFKRDRGLNDTIKDKLFKDKKEELNEEEEERINEELLKYDAKDTFNYLVKSYELYELLLPKKEGLDKKALKDRSSEIEKFRKKISGQEITKRLLEKYNIEQIRNYIIVKDELKMQSFQGFKPVNIASNISKNTAFKFYQKLNSLPGVNISLEPIRFYPYGDLACAAIGYVGAINSDKKNLYEERGYDASSDLIGQAGIESAFEKELKGIKGGNTIKVNSTGRKIEDLFKLETFPGNNITLTIDKNIQYSAETMLQHQFDYLNSVGSTDGIDLRNANRGAVVAIEVKTGRILALVSLPKYNPNEFASGQISKELRKKYLSPDLEEFGKNYISRRGLKASVDELFPDTKGIRSDKYDIYPKPIYNYATMGCIPPGSTFKPLTSVVALEEGVTDANFSINDSTYDLSKYKKILGANLPKDNNNHGGGINIQKALEQSCNNYFYDMAGKLYEKYEKEDPKKGLNSLSKYAWAFGLGADPKSNEKKSTGIEITENFGDSYNFESYKTVRIEQSKFELRDFLKMGNFEKRGTFFVPLDININEDDKDSNLEKAKVHLKEVINKKLNEIGTKNIADDYDTFEKDIRKCMQEYYDASPKYKADLELAKKNEKAELDIVSKEIATWAVYSIRTEMLSGAQLAYAAIGQGSNNFSPVQIASYIATLANGGTRYKVHLVDKIADSNGKVIEEYKPEVLSKVNISDKTVYEIKQGMYRANDSEGAAASSVFKGFPIRSGGKTGTASFKEEKEQKYIGREAFGMYVSFAPLDDPEIAVCVAIYDGGHGYFGAPVARAIYETYWRDKIKKENPNYVPKDMNGVSYDYTLTPPKLEGDNQK
ncbi:penicillin-binding protein 2 [Clostridium cavendishii DSM 21758]|uniref:Penicillin-binding protein 2 n=1 Tax=Clostridium cavendishii DSM 21758 TaxID=1121302 RepID=A0A1M6BK89_9CLOT|nr:penicillin-binding transpeptidase domain-containing protein [Clostridium cavendishii]SHI49124.1 penicillin-binding protein 2 [Clostridium cavendishii DSM 21758]